jgi:hypothetical protein
MAGLGTGRYGHHVGCSAGLILNFRLHFFLFKCGFRLAVYSTADQKKSDGCGGDIEDARESGRGRLEIRAFAVSIASDPQVKPIKKYF